MLSLIGVKKNVNIEVREKLSLTLSRQIQGLKGLKENYDEAVIISTCNRTEVYICSSNNEEISLDKIFDIIGWESSLKEYVFIIEDISVAKHLFEVVCGFHSKILGEDQILGQVKTAYELSLEEKAIGGNLLRLFQDAISCGKRFRTESRLQKIPVSSSSIAVNEAVKFGAKNIMVIGYGTIGSLVVKYALGAHFNNIFIVVRNKEKVSNIDDSRVRVLDFNEYRNMINEVDSIISCTSAPHLIIKNVYLNENGSDILLIDLALPRDIDKEIAKKERVTLLDIDNISKLDVENRNLRAEKMNENKYIVNEYLKEYKQWLDIREVTYYIQEMKKCSNNVVESRVKSFNKKCKNEEIDKKAQVLIKSTADYYVNRAIEVLKEEKLKGREEQCLEILQRIFMKN